MVNKCGIGQHTTTTLTYFYLQVDHDLVSVVSVGDAVVGVMRLAGFAAGGCV